MKFTALRPMLWTDKLSETIEFYTSVLGFACNEQNEEWGWASLQRDDVEIMVSKPNDHIAFGKPLFTGSFYINTTAVDAAWAAIKDRAKIVYAIENFEWQMREFAIYDNNGYILQIGQDISEIENYDGVAFFK